MFVKPKCKEKMRCKSMTRKGKDRDRSHAVRLLEHQKAAKVSKTTGLKEKINDDGLALTQHEVGVPQDIRWDKSPRC